MAEKLFINGLEDLVRRVWCFLKPFNAGGIQCHIIIACNDHVALFTQHYCYKAAFLVWLTARKAFGIMDHPGT